MNTGISLYPGLSPKPIDYAALVDDAAAQDITRIFTSLHIPEANRSRLRHEVKTVFSEAADRDMDIIADISPETQDLLGIDAITPQAFDNAHIRTVRFDYGFDMRKIALFSQVMQVQLNASTLTPDYLKDLHHYGARFDHIEGMHNFYPRPNTGLDENYFISQNKFLADEGIKVGAFIPSQSGRRGPLFEGLPTLECHRHASISLAARHMLALGVSFLCIGDSFPSHEELVTLGTIGKEDKNCVIVAMHVHTRDPFLYDLLTASFTARCDPARDAIRAAEGRAYTRDHSIRPDETGRRPRHIGDITVDNDLFKRYKGEVQIILRELPPEMRTNIIASIVPKERFLLDYITPGRPFRLYSVRK